MRTPIRKRQRWYLGCVVTLIAVAAGCATEEPTPNGGAPLGGGKHRVPDDATSLRAAYIEGVQAEASEAFHVARLDTKPRAVNRAQRIVSDFEETGATVRSDDSAWTLAVSTAGYGCAGDVRPVTGGGAQADANRVRYARMQKDGGPISEWYVNGPLGLEHGFELASAPPCNSGHGTELNIDVELGGDLEGSVTEEGDAVVLRNEVGKEVARYADLFARDATGRMLPSHLELSKKTVRIAVDAAGATYPLSVDPLIATQQAKVLAGDGRANDQMGRSVALTGNTAVIGAPNDDAKGLRSGAAYVFVRTGTTWTQQAKLVASDGDEGDAFGHSVAISGTSVIIGALNDEDGGQQSGSAYVFVREGTTWTQQVKLRGSGDTASDSFGVSVAISADTAVVGSSQDIDGVANAGSAYIFVRQGTTWTEQTKFLPPPATEPQLFGSAVAISGSTVVIGAPNTPPGAAGAAYVSSRTGTTWTIPTKLTPSSISVPSNRFGSAVAVSGDTALIGAPTRASLVGLDIAGAATVFARTGTTWAEQATFFGENRIAGDLFGSSVALSGETAVIGAPGERSQIFTNVLARGAAYVFTRAGTTWAKQVRLATSEGSPQDRFGSSVALDGANALIGTPNRDNQGLDSGSAYVFIRPPRVTAWTEQQELMPPEGQRFDAFGSSVAVANDTAIVGAPQDGTQGEFAGIAYAFVRTGTTWTRQARLLAADGAAGALFGGAVALSGDVAVIGARRKSDFGLVSGAAYVFVRDGATWTQRAKLLASDGNTLHLFGESVAISGDTILVGATGIANRAGAAYAFVRTGATWTQQAKLVASDPSVGRSFGASVALSGNTAVIGSPGTGEVVTEAGSAYVFVRDGAAWSQQAKLLASDGQALDLFGASVAVSQDTALIGAQADDDKGTSAGSAYVFVRNGTTWTQQAKLLPLDGGPLDQLGKSVALEGNTAVIGELANFSTGAAYVFARSGTQWTQQTKIAPTGTEGFAQSVAMSGNTVFIGAPQDSDQGNAAGAAFAFVLSEAPAVP